MYADLALENAAIKDVLTKNILTPSGKRQAVEVMVTEHRLSITLACDATGFSRAAYYKVPPLPQEKDAEVIDALNGIVERNGRWGFWKCFDRLCLDGRPWNHKWVWRVYCDLGLNIPRRTKRRIPKREPLPVAAESFVNQGWALDFMHDVLYDSGRFRTLNVIDEANREALAIQVAQSLPASMLIRTMDRLVAWYGARESIRIDNGPEMTCHDFVEWPLRKGIALNYIEPGEPNQNAYIERSTGHSERMCSTPTYSTPSNKSKPSPPIG